MLGLAVASCASLGSPDGGRYDEEPPVVLGATPANGAVQAKDKKISIWFDEYIKLENANEKVTVSPPQQEPPNIRAEGKRIRIDLFDDLLPNTTYTVDFSDAISDNNEGNPLGLFTYSFSTGERIDTMEVSGTVLNAEDLEPVKGVLVGLYPADSLTDSTFRTRPLMRVGRTNGSGRFTIKGVANGRYRAMALDDKDNDYRFSQKSERISFDTLTFETTSRGDWRVDTLWKDTARVASNIKEFMVQPYTHYYPDNLILRSFLEDGQDRHLLKITRETPEKFTLFFTAPSDSLPVLEGLNFDPSLLYVESSLHRDTITYWIPDTAVAYQDTLQFHLSYLETDTLGQLVMRTDSLQEIVPKQTHARLERERLKKSEEWEKEQEKLRRKAKGVLPKEENPYEHTYLEVSMKPGSSLDPNQYLSFYFNEPLAAVDTTLLHCYVRVDSLYEPVPYLFERDEHDPRRCNVYVEWQSKQSYRFSADSLAFKGIMGHVNRAMRYDVRVRSLDEYGTVFLQLSNLDLQEGEQVYVELLNKQEKPVARVEAKDNRADFFYLKAGEYYARLFVDRNGNGKWDTGNFDAKLQPEEVYYFPGSIAVRAKFDFERGWNVRGRLLTEQKPKAITKAKPDRERKTAADRNRQREEELRGTRKRR